MSETGPTPDPLADSRSKFEKERNYMIESRSGRTAKEALAYYQTAMKYFDLGLKLGRENPDQADVLVQEIAGYLASREQTIAEQLHPYRRKKQ